MNAYFHALCWALAMMGLAVLNTFDVITDGTAQALFTTLPILAVISINARGRCVRRKAA
ncbi:MULTISPECIES: hypothetical protein [Blastomonas]|uniref:hypothetical protein n=1 Tax=Blastomonas TaxID=150203 RepID=UPI0008588B10|nr:MULTISPECIES: hypothetical protein [Blastomonas]AOG01336.1 putative membrane protein [Blastomonas sp. RAC04]MDM7927808.1 hypothetical protein [Blastomonas fulva]MDM7965676.1 hypothetical protein [Blastomonas fulva]